MSIFNISLENDNEILRKKRFVKMKMIMKY